MAQDLTGKRVLFMATDGFEEVELTEPLKALEQAGATVEIASLKTGKIQGWDKTDWGKSVKAGIAIDDVKIDEWDALVLPGGQINPDKLREEKSAVDLVRNFAAADKTVAAICHAPWLLIEAGLTQGKKMTCYTSIRTDLKNAGADVQDESVVVDGNYITSRNPKDIPDFVDAIKAALAR